MSLILKQQQKNKQNIPIKETIIALKLNKVFNPVKYPAIVDGISI
jgi:hypothetical protein